MSNKKYIPKETYSPCRACGETFPRSSLLGITVRGWVPNPGHPDKCIEIRLRLCPDCWRSEMGSIRAIEWKGEHLSGESLNGGSKFKFPSEDDVDDGPDPQLPPRPTGRDVVLDVPR